MRQESRDAHYRSNFPKLDDQKWKINIYSRNKGGDPERNGIVQTEY